MQAILDPQSAWPVRLIETVKQPIQRSTLCLNGDFLTLLSFFPPYGNKIVGIAKVIQLWGRLCLEDPMSRVPDHTVAEDPL